MLSPAGPDAIAKGIASSEYWPGWVHQLDPFLVQFTEQVGIRWYGLAYLLGFFVGYWLIILMARRGRGSLPEEKTADFILAIVLGTMIGGRVGYALFYGPELLTDFSSRFPFWGVLRVWEGGMASHGGIAGIVCAAIYFGRKHKQDWMNLGDLACLGGSLGIAAGRIANFINGELYGRPVSSAVSWAVKFPSEAYLWLKHDAEKPITDTAPDLLPRLAEAAAAIGVQAQQWLEWCSQVRTSMQARSQIQTTIHQIIAATENTNQAVVQALEPVLTARHPYQLYGSVMEGVVLFLIGMAVWRKPRKPGVVGGIWIVSYAVMRILSEQFRMPDAHIGFQLFGLTRGQWISIGMLLLGVGVLLYALRRKTEPVGGWAKNVPSSFL